MMKEYKIIVAGSRDFTEYETVKRRVLEFVESAAADCAITIISGGAKGVDALGERLAQEMGWGTVVVKPDWRLGQGAGPARNTHMARIADALVAFWDGASRGTKDMITKAEKAHLRVRIVKISK